MQITDIHMYRMLVAIVLDTYTAHPHCLFLSRIHIRYMYAS